MPELPKARRGGGAAVSARGRKGPVRHYGPEDAGPTCGVCNVPVVRQLAGAGIREHPTCDPDMHELLKLSARAQALREATGIMPE